MFLEVFFFLSSPVVSLSREKSEHPPACNSPSSRRRHGLIVPLSTAGLDTSGFNVCLFVFFPIGSNGTEKNELFGRNLLYVSGGLDAAA